MIAGKHILSDELECKRWPYYLISPITFVLAIWVLLKKKVKILVGKKLDTGLLIFDGIGRYGSVVKRNVTGWKAVDLIYNHSFNEDNSIGGWLDDFWFESLNCQAARNRFKLCKREIGKAIGRFRQEQEIRMVSLAAGTGQIESETIATSKNLGFNIRAILVDREQEALSRAKEYVRLNKVQGEVRLLNSDINSVLETVREFKPHVIAMIAILDYLPEKEAISFVSGIHNLLAEGGVFIVTNTLPNIEMYFVKWVVGWPLIYRKPKEILSIVTKSGFSDCNIFVEPLNIQGVVVSRKT